MTHILHKQNCSKHHLVKKIQITSQANPLPQHSHSMLLLPCHFLKIKQYPVPKSSRHQLPSHSPPPPSPGQLVVGPHLPCTLLTVWHRSLRLLTLSHGLLLPALSRHFRRLLPSAWRPRCRYRFLSILNPRRLAEPSPPARTKPPPRSLPPRVEPSPPSLPSYAVSLPWLHAPHAEPSALSPRMELPSLSHSPHADLQPLLPSHAQQ